MSVQMKQKLVTNEVSNNNTAGNEIMKYIRTTKMNFRSVNTNFFLKTQAQSLFIK